MILEPLHNPKRRTNQNNQKNRNSEQHPDQEYLVALAAHSRQKQQTEQLPDSNDDNYKTIDAPAKTHLGRTTARNTSEIGVR